VTNTTEPVKISLRKIIKHRASFPTDEAALKLLSLAFEQIARTWMMPVKEWKAALNRSAILFEKGMPVLERGSPTQNCGHAQASRDMIAPLQVGAREIMSTITDSGPTHHE
jgi:hypothetical protein